jgi:flagellar export protein FliJ
MKRFVFPLERIRSWSVSQLQVEEAALEGLLDRARKAEEAYAAVCTQKSEYERQTIRQATIESTDLVRIEQFRQFVTSEGRRMRTVRAEYSKQISERRTRIIEIKRKIELFDRLKQRQKASWTAEEAKELQTAADEAFLQKIVAKRL